MKLGDEVTVRDGGGNERTGWVVAMRDSGTTIYRADGSEYKGIQFRVQPRNGKAFWTVTFPDPDRPVGATPVATCRSWYDERRQCMKSPGHGGQHKWWGVGGFDITWTERVPVGVSNESSGNQES